MTDRELLELAAKAAGLVIDKSSHNGGGSRNDGFDIQGNAVLDWHNGILWNPLTDDGDNARLRRSLCIVVQWFPTDVAAMHCSSDGRGRSWAEPYGDDPASAERRAVVRAAAEIGRTM